ncbi:ABC transporter permease [Rhodocytophaga aerolata]|uniref:ABC transporter permease n=1 Tax=Rhodocytophaga aerolata TaxID=455078 RepID=A0ABT8R8B3_9BACT|nr:ABC transporter permease [Rhodocytophaga aerolata]MDO1446997.1 ABC transporter permease [Rhodocytophaga aerolata]
MLEDAFRFLWYDKAKMFGILFGIVLSVFLIGQQLGICFSLLEGIVSLASNNTQYIWVVSEKSQQVNDLPALDMRIARELMSVSGVKRVNPIVVSGATAKFSNGTKAALTLIGTTAPTFAGGPWKLATGNTLDLLQEGALITDEYDGPTLNNITIGDHFELNGRRVVLVGQTRGARGLGVAYGFTTIERARMLSSIASSQASAFLVEWENSMEVGQVVRTINAEIPGIKAWEGGAFTEETLSYTARTSGIVASFGLLVVFAIITGFAIVGLTMYSAVNDRIRDYGTVKAIGGNNGMIRKLILLQACIYSAVGFVVAFVLLVLFVQATKTALDIQLTAGLIAFLIGVTLFISILGSLLAMRKITRLEPVQIFRI